MPANDKFEEHLLNPGNPYRAFWMNVALVALTLVIIGTIITGLLTRRRAPRPDGAADTTLSAASAQVRPATAADTAAASGSAMLVVEQLRGAYAAGTNRLQLREQCLELRRQIAEPAAMRALEDLLGALNVELVLSPAAMPEKTDYVVKIGDSLARIAKEFGTTVELLRLSNQLRTDVIRVGDFLRVFTAPFKLQVSKSGNELVVYAGADQFFKRYRVGTGKHGTTPVGVFVINDKIVEPPWWRPDGKVVPFGDSENVLGTRWMSLKPIEGTDPVRGYGIHGTWEPETIGHQASAGCVRMLNADVEQLYVLLPLGTRVVVEE